jgi:cysteine desulfurase
MMKTEFYFDYNATTPLDPRVFEEMKPFFSDRFHNPSSFYRSAGEVRQKIDISRNRVAGLINANQNEIYFTSGGTESDNLALIGTVGQLKKKGGQIIISGIEHPAVTNTCKYLEEKGIQVTVLPVDRYGLFNPKELEKNISDRTFLVSVMMANNEIGTIQPIKALCRIAHDHGCFFHTDAVQAIGKIPVDVRDLDVDLLSLSSHKIYGPKGMGALYKKSSVKIDPIIFGGGHERGLRGGTENVPGIVGLGKASELANREMADEERRIRPMRDRLQKELSERIPEILINGDTDSRLYNTLNISVRYIEGESMLALLDQSGIALSSGSACSSKSLEPSRVLLAIGLKPEDAHGSLRISLGKYNDDRDIDKLLEVLPPVVERLRRMSPFWKHK